MKIKYLSVLLFTALTLTACKSTQIEEPKEEIQPDPVIEEETVQEEYVPVEDDIEIIEEVIEPEISQEDAEYIRSTNDLTDETVSKEEFNEDKAAILEIIEELKEIMEKNDVKSWLKYISPASITYYSDPANVRKAQKKLPDKTIQLHGIGDYFKYVFVPARKRSRVDEIRYISKTNVKAVQVKEDESVVIYYYFVKQNGEWLVSIPEL